MTKPNETTGADSASALTNGLESMTRDLLCRLRNAIDAEPRHSANTRVVSLIDLCGAVQLIQAGAANLRDVERLDWLTSQHPPGAVVKHIIDDELRGTGFGSRRAIDDAMRSNALAQGPRSGPAGATG